MSNTKILVENGSAELFETLRETNVGILKLRTADCASLSSVILYTLKKLTKLILWGTYSGRCSLNLPETFQFISLQEVECSYDWLCSLLIALSSLEHYVKCEMYNVVLQPREYSCEYDSQTHVFDFRSEMLALDMSHMPIFVKSGSVEMFELLRDTNIGILALRNADFTSSASKILYTLKKLTKLYLWGIYSERCTLQLPETLQFIPLLKVECSSEWLCSLLIALFSLDHSVKC
ncbi:hypothetical protein DPMN_140981 [Dreissena polymorpha]|uniref:Uncharacterized protein n=1 Tax=Dreissena polymorpha TaxID=45954 RepID=A0A9D4GBU8_DREPO|nr:hypothetical protein DPMN_140981 [Dreissena polymorpha]